jgi:hypothetical protein
LAVPLAMGLVTLVLLWLAAIAVASIWLGRRLRTGATALTPPSVP